MTVFPAHFASVDADANDLYRSASTSWWLNLKLAVVPLASERDILRSGWNWLSLHLGGCSYEVFVTLRRESSGRYLVDGPAPVRPKRHGNVANRNSLGRSHRLAS